MSLAEALSSEEPVVVSAAAGWSLGVEPGASHPVGHCGVAAADPVLLARRVGSGAGRPCWTTSRAPGCPSSTRSGAPLRDVAEVVIDVDALTPSQCG